MGFSIASTILRTELEDRTPRGKLEGYQDYVKETPYRLFPGIWEESQNK